VRRNEKENDMTDTISPIADHKAAFYELIAGERGGDTGACRNIIEGCSVDAAIQGLSTSERITVALAFGRHDLLPIDYRDLRDACARLDCRQIDLAYAVAHFRKQLREGAQRES
jgi:hypothetical protein